MVSWVDLELSNCSWYYVPTTVYENNSFRIFSTDMSASADHSIAENCNKLQQSNISAVKHFNLYGVYLILLIFLIEDANTIQYRIWIKWFFLFSQTVCFFPAYKARFKYIVTNTGFVSRILCQNIFHFRVKIYSTRITLIDFFTSINTNSCSP